MTIPTARYSETATVRIDYEKCKACGLCVKVCKGTPLYLENNKVWVDQTRYFGCIGCGHCAAVCPTGAIVVEGREISQTSFMDIPAEETRAGNEELMALMLARRSIREFEDREVEQKKIDRILAAASMAPMGIPPSDVEVLVINGKEKVREFSDDILEHMKSQKWIFSKPALFLRRPFMKREEYEVMDKFMYPAIEIFEEMRKKIMITCSTEPPLPCTSTPFLMLIQQIPLSRPPMQCLQLKPWTLEAHDRDHRPNAEKWRQKSERKVRDQSPKPARNNDNFRLPCSKVQACYSKKSRKNPLFLKEKLLFS